MGVHVVTEEVRGLEPLGLEELRAAWRRRYGEPPKLRSVDLLRLSLAWRIQAEAFGGLDAATRRHLRDGGGGVGRTDHVGPGLRIFKEWRGRSYIVERTAEGCVWNATVYPSLSAVAQAITAGPPRRTADVQYSLLIDAAELHLSSLHTFVSLPARLPEIPCSCLSREIGKGEF